MSRQSKTIAHIAGLLLAASLQGGVAQARAAGADFMPAGVAADAPTGFIDMCARDAVLCGAGLPLTPGSGWSVPVTGIATARQTATTGFGTAAIAPARVAVRAGGGAAPVSTGTGDHDELKMLRRINSDVNRSVAQVADIATNGVDEYWQRPQGRYPSGDCEDIAIEKRMRLVEGGFDPTRLFFAVAYRSGFGLHTVLIGRLADGDYVLDSLSPHLLRWSRTHYSWLRQQSPGNPMEWRRIGAPPRGERMVDLTGGGPEGAAS